MTKPSSNPSRTTLFSWWSVTCTLILWLLATVPGAAQAPSLPDDELRQPADPSQNTIAYNNTIANWDLFDDEQDFLDAQRGLVKPLSPLIVRLGDGSNPTATCSQGCEDPPIEDDAECGTAIWDLTQYDFLNPYLCNEEPPAAAHPANTFPAAEDSVNPSLWRNSVLNTIHGVFEVIPGEIYQVRGYDLSNMSAIRGNNGWIIIDPLTTKETAKAALQNLNNAYVSQPGTNRQPLQVSAIIFTHSHVDHFGGIDGLAVGGGVLPNAPIYAPEGFFDEAVSENVTVGNAMGRRATYMYGPLLERGPRGQVDGGLGKSTPSGTTGIAEPTCTLGTGTSEGSGCGDLARSATWPELVEGTIDGIPVQFQNVPGSEAPAEMLFYFPTHQALCASEDVTHTFHNVLTLRGANVRDSLLWAKYLHKTLKFFPDASVLFASHHWPTWNLDPLGDTYTDAAGQPYNRVRKIIEKQRDLYRYIHDQSVRLTNKGYTIQEVGEAVELPSSLGDNWFNRDYYGTVNHNAKAVYQRYIGWFDANPASLHQLPPSAAAKKYVDYMGGPDEVVRLVRQDLLEDEIDYRWIAMVLNHVVFTTPYEWTLEDIEPGVIKDVWEDARLLLADTYDQLAYQAESGPWRNFYLTGAMELRYGVLTLPAVQTFTRDTVEAMSLDMIYDFVAVHVKGPEAGGADYVFRVRFAPSNGPGTEPSTLLLTNGVLNHDVGVLDNDPPVAEADATITLSRSILDTIVMGQDELGDPVDPVALICPDVQAPDCIHVADGGRATDGKTAVETFFGYLDSFDFWFPIVAPDVE